MQTKRVFIKTLLISLAAALSAGTAQAENTLWKASSAKGAFYIQGSVHLLKADDYPLAPAIEEAYSKSEVLVLEADMKEMLAPETQQLILAKAMLPGDETLETSLSPEVYKMLSEKMKAAGLPAAAFNKFKPWYVSMTLVLTKMQQMGFNPAYGIDQYFYAKATAENKEVIGLETVEYQINLFESLAQGNQDKYIKHTLKELDLLEEMLSELIAAWKTGDIEKLGQLMKESFKEYPDIYESFVNDRNKAWAEKLDAMASKEKTGMVVVGSGHLPGEKGLLKLLEKRGFKLEQL